MTQPNMPNLPGFDAMADTFEFVKNMWGGMQANSGIPGLAMPALSLEEINKQITDLKAVESWLNVNMTMLRGTIQALEVQSATIATLNAMGATFGAEMKSNPAASNTVNTAQNAMNSTPHADTLAQHSKSATAANPLHANAATDATTAWWNALQTQFNQAVSSVMADEVAAQPKKTTVVKPSAKSSASSAKKSTAKSGGNAAKNKVTNSTKTAAKKRAPSAKT